MKIRLMGLVAVMATAGIMVLSCEASKDDNTTDVIGDTVSDVTDVTEVVLPTYTWIRIYDDLTNTTLDSCTNPNPGADIDAVALYHGGVLMGWAGKVIATDLGNTCTSNTADNADEVLGEADETDPSDTDNLFVSLNGGEIVVQIYDVESGDPVVIHVGDEIVVYEVEGTTPEYYYIELCTDQTCANSEAIDGHGTGEFTFTY